jgi:hypothetical protein
MPNLYLRRIYKKRFPLFEPFWGQLASNFPKRGKCKKMYFFKYQRSKQKIYADFKFVEKLAKTFKKSYKSKLAVNRIKV